MASVTRELAPTLGPEEFPLLFSIWFMSPEAGPKPEQSFPDMELTGAGFWPPSPWKKMPEAEEDRDGPPPPAVTREGATGGVGPN